MLFCTTRNRSFKMHYKVLFIVILPHYSLSQRNGFTLDTCSYNDPIHVCLLQYVLWRQCTLVWKHDKDIYAHSLSIDFEVAVEHTHGQTDSTDTLASLHSRGDVYIHLCLRHPDCWTLWRFTKESAVLFVTRYLLIVPLTLCNRCVKQKNMLGVYWFLILSGFFKVDRWWMIFTYLFRHNNWMMHTMV